MECTNVPSQIVQTIVEAHTLTPEKRIPITWLNSKVDGGSEGVINTPEGTRKIEVEIGTGEERGTTVI